MNKSDFTLSLSLANASILQCIKEGYLLWLTIAPHIAKSTRYTLGARIENLFLDLLQQTYTAYFTPRERKEEKLRNIERCIQTLDILKYFVSLSWEGDVISGKPFEAVAQKLEEAGRRFFAWKESLNNPDKKNRTQMNPEKK